MVLLYFKATIFFSIGTMNAFRVSNMVSKKSSFQPLSCHETFFRRRQIPPQMRIRPITNIAAFSSASVPEEQQGTKLILTRTQIRKMKRVDLQEELARRGLLDTGLRPILQQRLLDANLESPTTSVVSGSTDMTREQNLSIKTSLPTPNPALLSNNNASSFLSPDIVYILRFQGESKYLDATAGCGVVIYDTKTEEKVWSGMKYLEGGESAIEAEYIGLQLSLKKILQLGAKKLVLQGCETGTVMQQLQGNKKVQNSRLKQLSCEVNGHIEQLDEFKVHGIATDDNKEALRLAQKAIRTRKTEGLDSKESSALDSKESSALDSKESSALKRADDLNKVDPNKVYLLQFDGGSRGNPGLSGTGMALFDTEGGIEVWSGYEYLEEKSTNNVAEYMGLLRGLQCAIRMGVKRITVQGDSQLIVKQTQGIYKVKNAVLKEIHMEVKNLSLSFNSFSIAYIPRIQNARADMLANKAMDLCQSSGLDCDKIHNISPANEKNTDHLNGATTGGKNSLPAFTEAKSEMQLSSDKEYILQFHGTSNHAGGCGAGFAIYDSISGSEVWAGSLFNPNESTDYEATYIAIILGMKCAKSMGIQNIIVQSNADLIMKQMGGIYKVKNEKLIQLHKKAMKFSEQFELFQLTPIKKIENRRAYDLVNEAIENKSSSGFRAV